MDYNPPISADELKSEFDKLKNVFIGSDSDAKFKATEDMMLLISRYLGNNIHSLDIYPITAVLAELARMQNGGMPEFIHSQKNHLPMILRKTQVGILSIH